MTFNHYFNNFSDMLAVILSLYLSLTIQQDLQPLCFDLFRDAVFHGNRGRVWARRVFEGEDRIVPHLLQQRNGLLEVLVRLAGKADDNIGRQADRSTRCLDPCNTLQIPLTRILALHPLQYI